MKALYENGLDFFNSLKVIKHIRERDEGETNDCDSEKCKCCGKNFANSDDEQNEETTEATFSGDEGKECEDGLCCCPQNQNGLDCNCTTNEKTGIDDVEEDEDRLEDDGTVIGY